MTTLAGSFPFSSNSIAPVKYRAISIPVITTLVMLIGSSVLLFARLGHYSLWTDEASTAITAVGVWRTGDTSAWLDDHNLLTYRDGLLLKNQKDRYTSPLQFYLAAPFIRLFGRTAFACRLPFALCGFGTVVLILYWLKRAKTTQRGLDRHGDHSANEHVILSIPKAVPILRAGDFFCRR